MKKILLALDDSDYSDTVMKHGIDLAKKLDGMLVGVFIKDLSFYYDASVYGDLVAGDIIASEAMQEETQQMEEAMSTYIDEFTSICEKEEVDYKVHKGESPTIPVLLDETTYADLMIIGAKTFFSYINEDQRLVRDVLRNSNCPVMVAPEEYNTINRNIITFDGSDNAMYAIKHFCYLFGDILDKEETILLSVHEEEGETYENAEKVFEYIRLHFPNIKLEQIIGENPAEEILHTAALANDAMLVLGGFGRNFFSRLLHKSVSKEIIEKGSVPTFISHH